MVQGGCDLSEQASAELLLHPSYTLLAIRNIWVFTFFFFHVLRQGENFLGCSGNSCSAVLSCILFYESQKYISLLVCYECPNSTLGWEMTRRGCWFSHSWGEWEVWG